MQISTRHFLSNAKALLPSWGEGHCYWTKRRVHPSPLGRVEGAIYRAISQEIIHLYLWMAYQFFGAIRDSPAFACELEREPLGFSSVPTNSTSLTNPTSGTLKLPYHSERSVPIQDLVQFLSCHLPHFGFVNSSSLKLVLVDVAISISLYCSFSIILFGLILIVCLANLSSDFSPIMK